MDSRCRSVFSCSCLARSNMLQLVVKKNVVVQVLSELIRIAWPGSRTRRVRRQSINRVPRQEQENVGSRLFENVATATLQVTFAMTCKPDVWSFLPPRTVRLGRFQLQDFHHCSSICPHFFPPMFTFDPKTLSSFGPNSSILGKCVTGTGTKKGVQLHGESHLDVSQ